MIIHATEAYSFSAVNAFRTTGNDMSGYRSRTAYVTEAVTFIAAQAVIFIHNSRRSYFSGLVPIPDIHGTWLLITSLTVLADCILESHRLSLAAHVLRAGHSVSISGS